MKLETLYRTITVDGVDVTGEDAPFCLDYYIVESDLHLLEGVIGALFYGVRVEKRAVDSQTVWETAQQEDLFVSEADVKAFVDLLARNTVTPTTLEDIVEDWRGSLQSMPLSLGA